MLRLVAAVAAVALQTAAAAASDIMLPGQLAWTAYETGSSGHNQAVAIGAALKNAVGTDLRVLPGKNDVSRLTPLRSGRIHFSATGIGAYMAQEGVLEFGDRNWGPQPFRLVIANHRNQANLAVAVAGDLSVTSYAELKGKRVAWVKGAPAINIATEAYLACGGLTWDDVVRVEFGGFADSFKGLGNGQVDAAFATTNSGMAYEAAAGPRGLTWPPIKPDDRGCFERMQAVAPYFRPNVASVGAGIDGGEPVPGATYAYPILIATEDQDVDLVYNMTKAIVELYDRFKDTLPGINGWHIDHQDLEWVIPYHEGAVRYYAEIGRWSRQAQDHHERLIARQQTLQAAWEALAAVPAADDADWQQRWAAARREALRDAGFEVAF